MNILFCKLALAAGPANCKSQLESKVGFEHPEALAIPRVGGQELNTSGLSSSGSHDGGVCEGSVGLEKSVNSGNIGAPLSDRDVNRDHGVLSHDLLVDSGLVDDGRHSNGGLTSLSISDDQLSLSSSDGDQDIYTLNKNII
eukprot:gene24720-biopygen10196